jgi:hypothetical protein
MTRVQKIVAGTMIALGLAIVFNLGNQAERTRQQAELARQQADIPDHKAQPTPTPAKPALPAGAGDAGKATDARPTAAHLGMMERYALWKAKKEADEKSAPLVAEQRARIVASFSRLDHEPELQRIWAEEKARLVKFDKSKMTKHLALLAFERKIRKALDDAAEKLKGKPDASDRLNKLVASQRKAIDAQTKLLHAVNPQGRNSNIVDVLGHMDLPGGNSEIGPDHDVSLDLLAGAYPGAIAISFQGDGKPLADLRAELDEREKKITSWLAEVKRSRK